MRAYRKETVMSKEDMISWLLREIASDRFRTAGSAGADGARFDQAAEWLRLNARSHGEYGGALDMTRSGFG